eukprot:3295724-Pleurochrysis_carterae.AAC.1
MRSHICLRIIAARHQPSRRSHPWAGKSVAVAMSDAQMACALPPSQDATHKSTHALKRAVRRHGRAAQRRGRATRS